MAFITHSILFKRVKFAFYQTVSAWVRLNLKTDSKTQTIGRLTGFSFVMLMRKSAAKCNAAEGKQSGWHGVQMSCKVSSNLSRTLLFGHKSGWLCSWQTRSHNIWSDFHCWHSSSRSRICKLAARFQGSQGSHTSSDLSPGHAPSRVLALTWLGLRLGLVLSRRLRSRTSHKSSASGAKTPADERTSVKEHK